jgi:hypothetical protein
MRTLNAAIQPDGALVDVLVGLSATDVQVLRNARRPIPTPHPVRAMIDSGAEVSCVNPVVLASLRTAGLSAKRFVFTNVPAAGGLTLSPAYNISLTIVHPSQNPRANLVLRNHDVIEQALNVLGYDVLLGRDVLSSCLFVYDGPSGIATLGY